jgi:hypothetical protein
VTQTIVKARRRLANTWLSLIRPLPFYPYLYRSRWHALLGRGGEATAHHYLTAIPNRGAGIGHQLANWIAGYWFARLLGTRFAHTPFASPAWERFLGLDAGETAAASLRAAGMPRVRLPLFDEDDPAAVARTRAIIASYRRPHLFVLEQDQFYRAQIGVVDALRAKYAAAPARREDGLMFRPGRVSLAVHIRRGDVTAEAAAANPNLALRYQHETYFETVLGETLAAIDGRFEPDIYIFSQGDPETLATFRRFPNVRFCTDMGAHQSFAHMAAADILITSKSSFSYKPALLGAGIRIVPAPFWHDYPASPDWIVADAEGRFDAAALRAAIARRFPA